MTFYTKYCHEPHCTLCLFHVLGRVPLLFSSSSCSLCSRPCACWAPTLCTVSVAVMSMCAYLVLELDAVYKDKKQWIFKTTFIHASIFYMLNHLKNHTIVICFHTLKRQITLAKHLYCVGVYFFNLPYVIHVKDQNCIYKRNPVHL